ncbi:myb-like protein AA [Microplitis mediator]|uniref:myb-like protein AA n=1 Tax=Microplitis mediator TaxID=375433 RepID=UPI002557975D|nr:myb-like protein AA [Microplitis mediator]
MVMAESERKSRLESNTTSTSRLQWLRQRREALEEKLLRKNNELKNLCIDEAELTGILPPEIPLDPGESPPLFRRRVGTSFAYPQNLINKLKSSEAEESSLELERQVQTSIAKAAFAIFNDSSEGKAVRRKHRLVYQQSQRRLKELETRLNFIRQGYGRLPRRPNIAESTPWQSNIFSDDTALPSSSAYAKHKSKKPRPPLNAAPDKILNPQANYDKTISKVNSPDESSVCHEQNHIKNNDKSEWMSANEGSVLGGGGGSSKSSRSDGISYEFNDNSDIYILGNQQHRASTYSHDADDGSLHHKHPQIPDRTYRIISNKDDNTQPNIWPREQKRQCEIPHHNRQQLANTYKQPSPRYHHYYHQSQLSPSISEILPSSQSVGANIETTGKFEPTTNQYRSRLPYYPSDPFVHVSSNLNDNFDEIPPSLHERNSIQDKMYKRNNHQSMPPISRRQEFGNSTDNWVINGDEILWPCPDYQQQQQHQLQHDRFGSIDRRKYAANNIHNYQTNSNTPDPLMATLGPTSGGIKPTQQKYMKQNNIGTFTDNQNNQSKYINSKQSQVPRPERLNLSQSTRTLLRTQSLGSVETWHPEDTKCITPVVETTAAITLPSPTAGSVYRGHGIVENSPETRTSYRDNEKEWYETSIDLDYSKPPATLSQTLKNLEIPAESNTRLSSNKSINGDVTVAFEPSNFASPDNKLTADGRTIIHAGKYQPYKEVTKPFEMSDFYKYSTKFRKKMEPGPSPGTNVHPKNLNNNNSSSNNNINNIDNNIDITIDNNNMTFHTRQRISTPHVPTVQSRICNPAQAILPCQSHIARRGNESDNKDCNNGNIQPSQQPSSKDSTVV